MISIPSNILLPISLPDAKISNIFLNDNSLRNTDSK